MPTSVPQEKPQPTDQSYGLDQLDLFSKFTRDTYLAAFGEQAPPFDATKQPKYWFDSSVPVNDMAYTINGVFPITWKDNGNGTADKASILINNRTASAVNIPGHYNYPKADPPKASGVFMQAGSAKQYIDASLLATMDQAKKLIADAEAAGIDMDDTPQVVDYAIPYNLQFEQDEVRQVITVSPKGGYANNVGQLLKQQSANGVGYPGLWASSNGSLVWRPSTPTETNSFPEIPVPQRDLKSNERFETAGMIGGTVIVNTSNPLVQQQDDQSAMASRIKEMYEMMKRSPFFQ